MIRPPPRSTPLYSSAASDFYKRQCKYIINDIASEFGGGGHKFAAGCSVSNSNAIEIQEKIVNLLNSRGFGTRNLPDAIKWHCSYYWQHALKISQVKKSKKTLLIC